MLHEGLDTLLVEVGVSIKTLRVSFGLMFASGHLL